MLATQYLEMRSFCDVMEKILQHNIPINFKSLGLGLARLPSLSLSLANQDQRLLIRNDLNHHFEKLPQYKKYI